MGTALRVINTCLALAGGGGRFGIRNQRADVGTTVSKTPGVPDLSLLETFKLSTL